ncbi:hypothetical protein HPB47_016852, partial [Ixodes persulcatus]
GAVPVRLWRKIVHGTAQRVPRHQCHFGDPHHYHLPFFGIYAVSEPGQSGYRGLAALESCHLKRKISHARTCKLRQTVEESMKAAEEPLAARPVLPGWWCKRHHDDTMHSRADDGGIARADSFDCESQWNALAAAAQQGQQETQAKPLWSQLTSCESPPTEPELETCVGEHGSVDTATVPFADEQHFKKQKVKDAPVLSLPQMQSMDFSCVKSEASNWPTTLNGILNQSDAGPRSVGASSAAPFGVPGSYENTSHCPEPAAHLAPSKALLSQTAGRREGMATMGTRRVPGSNMDHLSAMSMLPESELLRMINPNAFDN